MEAIGSNAIFCDFVASSIEYGRFSSGLKTMRTLISCEQKPFDLPIDKSRRGRDIEDASFFYNESYSAVFSAKHETVMIQGELIISMSEIMGYFCLITSPYLCTEVS